MSRFGRGGKQVGRTGPVLTLSLLAERALEGGEGGGGDDLDIAVGGQPRLVDEVVPDPERREFP